MNKKGRSILSRLTILILFSALGSCVTLNSHQTGRTVGKGNFSGLGSYNFGYFDSEQYFTIENPGPFYISEIGVLYGVSENIDFGLKVNSSLHFTGMSKFQFIGSKKSIFSSSLGVNIGAAPFGLVMGVMSYSGTLSIYNSIHPTEYLAFTLSPRYTYLGFTNFTEKYGFTRENNIYGYSTGVIIGKKHQFTVELSQFVNDTAFRFDTKPIFSMGYILNIK